MRSVEKEIAKWKFYDAKKSIKTWDVNDDNKIISKSIEITNSKYLIGIKFDKSTRPLVLIMPKMSGFVTTFKYKERNYKLMSFCIDDKKLLEKYKAIWTKIEYLKNI